jgi:hypothetical protein
VVRFFSKLARELDRESGRGAHLIGGTLGTMPKVDVVFLIVLLNNNIGISSVELSKTFFRLFDWVELLDSVDLKWVLSTGG